MTATSFYESENQEIRFLARYYRQRLVFLEQIEFSAYQKNQLLDIGQEASSLNKLLIDLEDENYHDLIQQVAVPIHARERLQQFLRRLMQYLGETSEQALFYLYPETIELPLLQTAQFDGETFELRALLEWLDAQAEFPVDVNDCFETSLQMQQWQAKTTCIMREMLAYMAWTLQKYRLRPSGWAPVFMLRDTLFLYLGYVWLYRKGLLPETPQPLLLSRNFLRIAEGNEDCYESLLIDTIYHVLNEQPRNADIFFTKYAHALKNNRLPTTFQEKTRTYLHSLVGTRPVFIVESGMFGTMPLWVLTQCDNPGTFLLYNTVPWLFDIYSERVFHRNYNYLRDLETTVAQNYLFQLDTICNNKISVKKTGQPRIEKLALYELHVFRKLLEQCNLCP